MSHLNDGLNVVTSAALTVQAVPASVKLPATASTGSTIEVEWTGPNRRDDYVDLVPVDATNTSGELSYFNTESNPAKGVLSMPEQAGQYKVRYILQGIDRTVLSEQTLNVN